MASGSLPLAAVGYSAEEDMDDLLACVARELAEAGYRTAGVVQHNRPRPGYCRCDMDLKLLPDGKVFPISLDLGPEAEGCRLDAGAIELAVVAVQENTNAGCDIVIINKFGKREATGKGFAPVIANALARGIPVLVGISRLNERAFESFAAGLQTVLPPKREQVVDWCRTVLPVISRESAA